VRECHRGALEVITDQEVPPLLPGSRVCQVVVLPKVILHDGLVSREIIAQGNTHEIGEGVN
jgi:hypothetical protein